MTAPASTITCYHASFDSYSAGHVLIGGQRTLGPLQSQVEDILERHRPPASVSRLVAIFVTDDPAHALKFLNAEPNPGKKAAHVYEVRIDACDRHPLVLVDRIARLAGDPRVDDIAEEYWRPQTAWRFVERLAMRAEVVSEIVGIGIVALTPATLAHGGDHKQGKKLWP